MNLDITGYFWYSEQQAETVQHMGYYHKNYCQLDDGKIVPYTEWTHDNKPSGKWDDYKSLGHGKYLHTEK
jgi:hypothetical protein